MINALTNWISVKERLPMDGEDCIVYMEYYNKVQAKYYAHLTKVRYFADVNTAAVEEYYIFDFADSDTANVNSGFFYIDTDSSAFDIATLCPDVSYWMPADFEIYA